MKHEFFEDSVYSCETTNVILPSFLFHIIKSLFSFIFFPLQILVKCNIGLNVGDKEGLTPAMWACHFDRKQNFETLLNVESYSIPAIDGIERDKRGRTWIHWSVYSQSPDWSHDCLKVQ